MDVAHMRRVHHAYKQTDYEFFQNQQGKMMRNLTNGRPFRGNPQKVRCHPSPRKTEMTDERRRQPKYEKFRHEKTKKTRTSMETK